MASGFDSAISACEGLGCRVTTDVTYCVEEKKKLCEECATKTRWVRKETKGVLNLLCQKHDQPISIYCKTHDVGECHLCAVIKHQKPCELQDVDDAIAEKKQQLIELQATARDRKTQWKQHGDQIRNCEEYAQKHMKSVQDEINSLIDDEIKTVNDKAQCQKVLTNSEADDELRQINKKRETRLKQCTEHTKKQIESIEDKRQVLHNDGTIILDVTRRNVHELQKQTRDVMEAIDTSTGKIESLLQDDKKLVNNVQKVIASLAHTLEQIVEEGVVENITRTLRGVRFIVENEKYNRTIGQFDGKWELAEKIRILDEVVCPYIAGCISGADIVITEFAKNMNFVFCIALGHSYKLNINNKLTKKVITCSNRNCVASCALLNQETIVCGMHIRNNRDDAIRMYDVQWNLIKTLSIPFKGNFVNVCVDKDGMIIAADGWSSKIYVIDPSNGGIVKTIACKSNIRLCGTLSSGDFIAIPCPSDDKILVINRIGAQMAIDIGGKVHHCAVDPLTEDLYPVYNEPGQNTFTIDHLSGNGEEIAKRILQFTPSSLEERLSRVVITPSGKIVVCDGKECLVYKKTVGFNTK